MCCIAEKRSREGEDESIENPTKRSKVTADETDSGETKEAETLEEKEEIIGEEDEVERQRLSILLQSFTPEQVNQAHLYIPLLPVQPTN